MQKTYLPLSPLPPLHHIHPHTIMVANQAKHNSALLSSGYHHQSQTPIKLHFIQLSPPIAQRSSLSPTATDRSSKEWATTALPLSQDAPPQTRTNDHHASPNSHVTRRHVSCCEHRRRSQIQRTTTTSLPLSQDAPPLARTDDHLGNLLTVPIHKYLV